MSGGPEGESVRGKYVGELRGDLGPNNPKELRGDLGPNSPGDEFSPEGLDDREGRKERSAATRISDTNREIKIATHVAR